MVNGNNHGCPACGAPEVEASTPRTVYACGSSDYDQRPGTFRQAGTCVRRKVIYLAGPLFTSPERLWNEQLAAKLNSLGYVVFLPQAECMDAEIHDDKSAIYDKCIEGIESSDVVLACVDGTDADSGTSFELGYACANNKLLVLYRTDFRNRCDDGGVNLMLSRSCECFLQGSTVDEIAVKLSDYLSAVALKVREYYAEENPNGL